MGGSWDFSGLKVWSIEKSSCFSYIRGACPGLCWSHHSQHCLGKVARPSLPQFPQLSNLSFPWEVVMRPREAVSVTVHLVNTHFCSFPPRYWDELLYFLFLVLPLPSLFTWLGVTVTVRVALGERKWEEESSQGTDRVWEALLLLLRGCTALLNNCLATYPVLDNVRAEMPFFFFFKRQNLFLPGGLFESILL